MLKIFFSEARNAPVSFAGGIIAILGFLYSVYVFLLNGNLPNIAFASNVLKLLILVILEAPLAYFFVHLHLKIVAKGHGLPLIANILTIMLSALVTCFNVSVLSFQDMLQGSAAYFIAMLLISLILAIYLLGTEIYSSTNETMPTDEKKGNWLALLAAIYTACFMFCGTTVFPDIYKKACEARLINGEDWQELSNYKNNCNDYLEH